MAQISKTRIPTDGNRRLVVGADAGKVTVEIVISRAGVWGHVATLVLAPAHAEQLEKDLAAARVASMGRRARRLAGVK